MAEPRDEFFIGYLPKAPASYASHVRVWAIVLVLAAVLGALLAASSQRDFDDGYFEFGKLRIVDGRLTLQPVPMISFPSTIGHGSTDAEASYLLVGLFKHSIPESLSTAGEGAMVQFDGTFIHRRGLTMIEVTEPDSVVVREGQTDPVTTARPSARISLVGEIIDSKCFLGVMRPATGKVHRACAIRCISGGVPPAFLVRASDGSEMVMLLAGSGLRPFVPTPDIIGVSVNITGIVEMQNGVPVLFVEKVNRQLAAQ